LSLLGVASPSLLIHGRVGLDRVEGHTRAPANLVGQGYMTVAELATCRVPEDPTAPVQAGGDTSWCVQHFMSSGLVCHHTSFFTRYASFMTWNCIT
jgi:hypothetical protein